MFYHRLSTYAFFIPSFCLIPCQVTSGDYRQLLRLVPIMLFSVFSFFLVAGWLHSSAVAALGSSSGSFQGPGRGHAAFHAERRHLFASRPPMPKVSKRDQAKYLNSRTRGIVIHLILRLVYSHSLSIRRKWHRNPRRRL